MFSKKIPVLKVIMIVWLVLATCYVVYGEYTRFKIYIAQRSYNMGLTEAVNQLIQQAQTCQPIPVTSGDQSIQLISLDCLKAPAATGGETK